MISLDSLHTIRMGRPTPGAVEQTPNVAPRVAINLGATLNWWFSDPEELAELEEAARTQRLRLEAILGHVPVDGERAPARLPNIGTMPSMPALASATSTSRAAEPSGAAAPLEPGPVGRVFPPDRLTSGEPAGPTSRHGEHGHSDQAQPSGPAEIWEPWPRADPS